MPFILHTKGPRIKSPWGKSFFLLSYGVPRFKSLPKLKFYNCLQLRCHTPQGAFMAILNNSMGLVSGGNWRNFVKIWFLSTFKYKMQNLEFFQKSLIQIQNASSQTLPQSMGIENRSQNAVKFFWLLHYPPWTLWLETAFRGSILYLEFCI